MAGCISSPGSYGTYFKMLVENSDVTDPCEVATFDNSSERYEIINEDIRYSDEVVGSAGLTGVLDPIANHLRSGTRIVSGNILMEMGPNELANWLPRILWTDAGGTPPVVTYEIADDDSDMHPFDLMIKRDQGTVVYRHCVVVSTLFQGRQASQEDPDQQVLRVLMTIVGIEELDATWPDPEPALPSTQRLFWLFGDCELIMTNALGAGSGAVNLPIDAFNLTIANRIDAKPRNNLTLTHIRSLGRTIRLQCPTPYTEDTHDHLYIERFDGAGYLQFRGDKNLAGATEEPYLTKFDFPRLYQQRRTPSTRGRGEIPLSLDLTAYRTAASKSLTVTNQLTAS